MGGAVGENAWENRAGFFALEFELDFFKKTGNFITSRNCKEQGTLWTEMEGGKSKERLLKHSGPSLHIGLSFSQD